MARLLRAATIGIAVLAGGEAAAGDGQTGAPGISGPEIGRAAVRGNVNVEPAEASAAMPMAAPVVYERGRLSVALDKVPLREVAEAVSRHTGIEIRFVGEAPAVQVERRFRGYTLEKGLRLIFNGVDTVFVYADAGGNAGREAQISRIFILPKGEPGDPGHGAAGLADTLSGIAAQIEGAMSQSPADATPGASTNPAHADQALDGLADQLREQLQSLDGLEALQSDPTEASKQ